MLKPQALVITGDGINCEGETARAFELAGAQSTIMHINDWLARPRLLFNFQLLALPGGFSFGDYLGAGQVMALKIKQGAFTELKQFIENDKGVIGICNGLQILLRLGLLPGGQGEQPTMALTHNRDGKFIDKWVALQPEPKSGCWWTQALKSKEVYLPIRHGEGRFVFADCWQGNGVNELAQHGQIALRYRDDINGSAGLIAGICNQRGNVFGLMPHPEGALREGGSPLRGKADNFGLTIFRNGVKAVSH